MRHSEVIHDIWECFESYEIGPDLYEIGLIGALEGCLNHWHAEYVMQINPEAGVCAFAANIDGYLELIMFDYKKVELEEDDRIV